MASFVDDVQNKPSAEIKSPPPLPAGTYLVILTGQPIFGQSSQKKTPQVDFPAKIVAAQGDVAPDALAQIPGGVQGMELKDRRGLRFYLTEESVFIVNEFLKDHLGIEQGNKTLREMISEAPGKQVLVTIRNVPSQDGKRINAEVAGTARYQS